jgi:hypothetical protein
LAAALDPGPYELVRQALENGDAEALFRLQPLWVARYCHECAKHYCKRHWKLEVSVPSWGDAYSMDFVTTGTCPAGHKRQVERKLPRLIDKACPRANPDRSQAASKWTDLIEFKRNHRTPVRIDISPFAGALNRSSPA